MFRTCVAVLALAALAGPAHADEKTARESFEAGERAYNLGDFPKAIELYRAAYEAWPEPTFLFNLAQTYRQTGECRQAAFFYKRFLALKEQDTKKPLKPALKTEVEKRIADLDDCAKHEADHKAPPVGPTPPVVTTPPPTEAVTTTAAAPTPEPEHDVTAATEVHAASGNERASAVTLRLALGLGKISAGDLDVPLQFASSFVGGYPIALGALSLELGAALSFTRISYDTTTGMGGTGSLLGLLANVGAAYHAGSRVAARLEVGAGMQRVSGFDHEGNPFTEGGAAISSASTFLLRLGLSADYAVTPNLVVTVTPIAFSYSPAPSDFASDISSLTTLAFLAGIGYQR